MSVNYNGVEWYQDGNCANNQNYGSLKSYGQILYMDPTDGLSTLGNVNIIAPTPIEENPKLFNFIKPHKFKGANISNNTKSCNYGISK